MSIRPIQSSDLATRFPGLLGLARDYINVSWDFEFDEPEDGVLSFVNARPELASSCAAGLDSLMAECPDEAARLRTLSELGWGYAPRAGKLDTFLIWARDMLARTSTTETAAG